MSRNFPFVTACACFMAVCAAIYCFSERTGAEVSCSGYTTSCATYTNYYDGMCCLGSVPAFTLSAPYEGATKTAVPGSGSCGTFYSWYGIIPCGATVGTCGGTRASGDCL